MFFILRDLEAMGVRFLRLCRWWWLWGRCPCRQQPGLCTFPHLPVNNVLFQFQDSTHRCSVKDIAHQHPLGSPHSPVLPLGLLPNTRGTWTRLRGCQEMEIYKGSLLWLNGFVSFILRKRVNREFRLLILSFTLSSAWISHCAMQNDQEKANLVKAIADR